VAGRLRAAYRLLVSSVCLLSTCLIRPGASHSVAFYSCYYNYISNSLLSHGLSKPWLPCCWRWRRRGRGGTPGPGLEMWVPGATGGRERLTHNRSGDPRGRQEFPRGSCVHSQRRDPSRPGGATWRLLPVIVKGTPEPGSCLRKDPRLTPNRTHSVSTTTTRPVSQQDWRGLQLTASSRPVISGGSERRRP
jgi:hypothetical protein